jgi:hypothetical protein
MVCGYAHANVGHGQVKAAQNVGFGSGGDGVLVR